jgi:O-antigen/teichoic acid export membrane protein
VRPPIGWREALALVGVQGAWILLIQLERLVIPSLLPLADLATFAVLAAVVGSPFRMLEMGVGHTLMPRLRAAGSALERRRILAREGLIVGGVVAAAGALVWLLTPPVVRLFVGDKYVLGPGLVAAALAAGVVKVGAAFCKSVVAALGSTREIACLPWLSWTSVGVGLASAVLLARFGLIGAVCGVGLGWLGHGLAAAALARRPLRTGPSRSPW